MDLKATVDFGKVKREEATLRLAHRKFFNAWLSRHPESSRYEAFEAGACWAIDQMQLHWESLKLPNLSDLDQ